MRGYIYRRFIHRILRINDTPESIALGTAMGIFIAMTPTVGIQMIIVVVVGSLIRANRLAGLVMVFISNPFTIVPLYWLDYWLGARLLGTTLITRESFEESLHLFLEKLNGDGLWDAMTYLVEFKLQIVVPMLAGGVIVGLLAGIPSYPVTLQIVRAHQRRVQHKKALLKLRALRREAREKGRDAKEIQ